MKCQALFLLATLALAQAKALLFTEEELESKFEQFKNDFSRSYATLSEELARKSIFRSNLEFITRHNQAGQGHSYKVGVNQFADMTNEEFRKEFLKFQKSSSGSGAAQPAFSLKDLPDQVDWRTQGIVSPVINQGQCGASWAIPVVGSVEAAHAFKSRPWNLTTLSIQQLIDCCAPDGDYGCNGGTFDDGFKCIIRMGGLDTAASYPYTGDGDQKCRFNPKTVGSTISFYQDVNQGDDNALQYAVATQGPTAVGIDASQQSFQFYQSGIYFEPKCSTTPDHGMTLIGYGYIWHEFYQRYYWIVKNSWGVGWGEKGYIRMSMGTPNFCGISSAASYAVIQ